MIFQITLATIFRSLQFKLCFKAVKRKSRRKIRIRGEGGHVEKKISRDARREWKLARLRGNIPDPLLPIKLTTGDLKNARLGGVGGHRVRGGLRKKDHARTHILKRKRVPPKGGEIGSRRFSFKYQGKKKTEKQGAS